MEDATSFVTLSKTLRALSFIAKQFSSLHYLSRMTEASLMPYILISWMKQTSIHSCHWEFQMFSFLTCGVKMVEFFIFQKILQGAKNRLRYVCLVYIAYLGKHMKKTWSTSLKTVFTQLLTIFENSTQQSFAQFWPCLFKYWPC